jgi:hypothetical protein
MVKKFAWVVSGRLEKFPNGNRWMKKCNARYCKKRKAAESRLMKKETVMFKIEIYDPPMCCPTGVCGPNIDPKLVQFAADLDWLKEKGVVVERYNLAQQADKFAECKTVTDAMALAGELCLPLILANGEIVSRNAYPKRADLARFAGVDPE